MSLTDVVRYKKLSQINHHNIFSIKRSIHGQLYLLNDLHNICHFGLSTEGMKMLTKICSVDLITGFGISLPQHEKVRHCRSVSGVTGQSNVDNVDSRLLKIVSSIAVKLLPKLIHEVQPKSSDHVDISMSLGLTNQKCHEYIHFTHFNHVLPGLVNLPPYLSDDIICNLSTLATYFSNVFIPHHNLEQSFPLSSVLDSFAMSEAV